MSLTRRNFLKAFLGFVGGLGGGLLGRKLEAHLPWPPLEQRGGYLSPEAVDKFYRGCSDSLGEWHIGAFPSPVYTAPKVTRVDVFPARLVDGIWLYMDYNEVTGEVLAQGTLSPRGIHPDAHPG